MEYTGSPSQLDYESKRPLKRSTLEGPANWITSPKAHLSGPNKKTRVRFRLRLRVDNFGFEFYGSCFPELRRGQSKPHPWRQRRPFRSFGSGQNATATSRQSIRFMSISRTAMLASVRFLPTGCLFPAREVVLSCQCRQLDQAGAHRLLRTRGRVACRCRTPRHPLCHATMKRSM